MDHFNAALADVLKHEGGYSDHKADLGGATHFGISLRFLKQLPDLAGDINGDGHINVLDIQQMTAAHAAEFYRQYFWLHYRLEQVHSEKNCHQITEFIRQHAWQNRCLNCAACSERLVDGVPSCGRRDCGQHKLSGTEPTSGRRFVCLLTMSSLASLSGDCGT